MARGRNKALPPRIRDYPDYVYIEYPKIIGNTADPGEPTKQVSVIARSKEHEAELRVEHPDLPPWVPPPVSLSMKDMKSIQEEIAALRLENARLKAGGASGDIVVDTSLPLAPRDEPRPQTTVPTMPRDPSITDPEVLAAGEHPDGDPWANQPENATPEPAKPPSIKAPAGKHKPENRLGR